MNSDAKFHSDVIDGLFPQGNRPKYLNKLIDFCSSKLVESGMTEDMIDENRDDAALNYAIMGSTIYMMIAPRTGKNEDIIRYFRLLVSMIDSNGDNKQAEAAMEKILIGSINELPEIRQRVNATMSETSGTSSYAGLGKALVNAGRKMRSESIFNDGINIMKQKIKERSIIERPA